MSEESESGKSPSRLATVATMVQLLSIVAGVVISVASYFSAQKAEAASRAKEAEARRAETELRRRQQDTMEREQQLKSGQAALEAIRPFLQLRQDRYMETAHVAGMLGSPEGHDPLELKKARKRFYELYYSELTFVEDRGVESAMVQFLDAIDDPKTEDKARKRATLKLAEALRTSLLDSWRLPFDTAKPTDASLNRTSPESGTSAHP